MLGKVTVLGTGTQSALPPRLLFQSLPPAGVLINMQQRLAELPRVVFRAVLEAERARQKLEGCSLLTARQVLIQERMGLRYRCCSYSFRGVPWCGQLGVPWCGQLAPPFALALELLCTQSQMSFRKELQLSPVICTDNRKPSRESFLSQGCLWDGDFSRQQSLLKAP